MCSPTVQSTDHTQEDVGIHCSGRMLEYMEGEKWEDFSTTLTNAADDSGTKSDTRGCTMAKFLLRMGWFLVLVF
jgi:phosphopentomutase